MGLFGRWLRARSGTAQAPGLPPDPNARRLEAEFATIFANSALGIGVFDNAGCCVRANAAMERFLGYGCGELPGLSVQQLTHPDDLEEDLDLFRQVMRGERPVYQLDKRYIRKDGTVVWGRLIASIARNPDGTAGYGIGMVEDITERRRVQQQLEDANRRLALYLDRAPLACVIWGPDQIVRVWNPAAERLFGYTAAEAIGRNVYELTSTPEALEVIAKTRERFRAGDIDRDTSILLNRRKDGSLVHVEWHFTVVTQFSDAVNGVIAFGSDVSDRIRSEQERRLLESNLRHAQKMQSLGTLAGGIAHDFNNLLLAISGNTRLAIQDLPADHEAQVSLAEVDKAAARARGVVNQILTFSRREDSQLGPVDLGAIIEDTLNLLRATLSPRISIRTNLASPTAIVQGDAAQIRQVVLNLATNATYAMKDGGGALTIELDEVAIDADTRALLVPDLQAGAYQRMTVRDTGPGMSSQVLERIFEPFFTTKPPGQGTGLGLAVVHGIVRSHGGAIRANSVAGNGSAFEVWLPALQSPPQQLQIPSVGRLPTASMARGQRVLYVDDEESLVYLITRVLERLGYRVFGYTDVRTALESFRADPDRFDAIVTDLSMPGMSGSEFARAVLQLRPHLPVVMTSGYVRPEDHELARQIGVREMLLKPNTVDALGDVLHRLLTPAAAVGD